MATCVTCGKKVSCRENFLLITRGIRTLHLPTEHRHRRQTSENKSKTIQAEVDLDQHGDKLVDVEVGKWRLKLKQVFFLSFLVRSFHNEKKV